MSRIVKFFSNPKCEYFKEFLGILKNMCYICNHLCMKLPKKSQPILILIALLYSVIVLVDY